MVESVSRNPHTRQPTMKPECVTDYNINMGLVDESDAMISSIDCARNTLKWYKKFFFHLLDITMLNAHIIHRVKSGKKSKLKKIVVEVIRQLLSEHGLERPAPGLHSASGNPTRLTGRRFIPTMKASPESRKNVSRELATCADTQHAASNSAETPATTALCLEPCFEQYHTLLRL